MNTLSAKTRTTLAGALLIGLGLVTAPASSNLLVNGGFEDTPVNTAQRDWQAFKSGEVSGWQGDSIELWNGRSDMLAFEGDQLAELNAHGKRAPGAPFSMYQVFDTDPGALYDLSFAYGARSNNDEAFLVDVADTQFLIEDHVVNAWSRFQGNFQAVASQTMLRFTAITPDEGTKGNFLDDVSVTRAAAPVPAPSTAMLLLFGSLLLITGRRLHRRER